MDMLISLIVVIISQCITYINNNLSIYNFILFISLNMWFFSNFSIHFVFTFSLIKYIYPWQYHTHKKKSIFTFIQVCLPEQGLKLEITQTQWDYSLWECDFHGKFFIHEFYEIKSKSPWSREQQKIFIIDSVSIMKVSLIREEIWSSLIDVLQSPLPKMRS